MSLPFDPRRSIYGCLDVGFALVYVIVIWKVIPNRLPSAAVHLWTIPALISLMGTGTLRGGPRGWRLAVIAASLLLLAVFAIIVRILISAAFLAGVYGAFGQAAASFALVAIALVIEFVALLPIVQLKFLMSRRGRAVFGV